MDGATNPAGNVSVDVANRVRADFLRSLRRLGRRRRADLFAMGLWAWFAWLVLFVVQRLVRTGWDGFLEPGLELQVGFVLFVSGPVVAFLLAHLSSSRGRVVRGLDRELALRGLLTTCYEAPGGKHRILNLLLTRAMLRELAPERIAARLASSRRARAVRRRRARRAFMLLLLILLLLFLAMLLLPPLGPEGFKPHGEQGSRTASTDRSKDPQGEGREREEEGAGARNAGIEEEGGGSTSDVDPNTTGEESQEGSERPPESVQPRTREEWLLPLREALERSGRKEELYVVAGPAAEREGSSTESPEESADRFVPRNLEDLKRAAENPRTLAGLDPVERAWIEEYFALLREL